MISLPAGIIIIIIIRGFFYLNYILNCIVCYFTDPEEEEERAMLMTESGEMMESVPGIILFEDEDTRAFYQDFKDLRVYLPHVAYRESVQQATEEVQITYLQKKKEYFSI